MFFKAFFRARARVPVITYDPARNEFSDGSKLQWRIGESLASARIARDGSDRALDQKYLDAKLEFRNKMKIIVPVCVDFVVIEKFAFVLKPGATVFRLLSEIREAFKAPLCSKAIEFYKTQLQGSDLMRWKAARAMLETSMMSCRLDIVEWAGTPSPWFAGVRVERGEAYVLMSLTSSYRPSRTSTT